MSYRHEHNHVCFAKRGSRNRQAPLLRAIQQGVQQFELKWGIRVTSSVSVQPRTPGCEPCLSITDYVNWAVQRAFSTGEMRYYREVERNEDLLVDLYDTDNYPRNWYTHKNPLDMKEIAPL